MSLAGQHIPREFRHDGGAKTAPDVFGHGGGIIAVCHHVWRDAKALEIVEDDAADGKAFREENKPLAPELEGIHIGLFREGIIGPERKDDGLLEERGGPLVTHRPVAGGKDQVCLWRPEGFRARTEDIGVGTEQTDDGIGMVLAETVEEGGNDAGRGIIRNRHGGIFRIFGRVDGPLHFMQVVQNDLGIIENDLAILGQLDIPALPFEELHAQIALHAGNGSG